MDSNEKTAVWGSGVPILVNLLLHSYVLAEALISVPQNLVR
nr:hypothetical protein [Candidatus Njordarchaeota archaeon]